MADPERIYLQPMCCAEYSDYGRLWCEHADELECDDGAQPTAYVLEASAQATLAARDAEIAALRAFVRSVADMPDVACAREETAWNLRDQARALTERQP